MDEPFHDTAVLDSRLLTPSLLPHPRTISSGVSPLRNSLKPLLNVEDTVNENQRNQVLDTLMLLAGEGVDLSDHHPYELDQSSYGSPLASSRSLAEPEESNSRKTLRQTNCVASLYDSQYLLGSCNYTDMSFASFPARGHHQHTSASASMDESMVDEFGGLIYWVDARRGTLGVIDLTQRTRRTLLRGLTQPQHIQVVENRVYWLESGSEWRFDGRLCFLERTTERVHVLLNGLQYPRGLHVTTDTEDVYFIEVHRKALQNDESWQVEWHVNCVPGQYATVAVAGANFGLARHKRTVGILPDPKELANRLYDHDSEGVDRLEENGGGGGGQKNTGGDHKVPSTELSFAFPTDISVIASGERGVPPVAMVGVSLYAVANDANAAAAAAAAAGGGGGPSSQEETLASSVPPFSFEHEGRTLLKGLGNVHLQALGGALLWMDVPSLLPDRRTGRKATPVSILKENSEGRNSRNSAEEEEVNDENPEDNNEEVSSGALCVLGMSIHRVKQTVVGSNQPTDGLLGSLLVSNTVGSVSDDRPFPRNKDENDAYLYQYGGGLAQVHVPSRLSFDAADQSKALYYLPLLSDPVKCLCTPLSSVVLSPSNGNNGNHHHNSSSNNHNNQSSGASSAFVYIPVEERGLHVFHATEDGNHLSATFSALCNERGDVTTHFSNPEHDQKRLNKERLAEYVNYVRPVPESARSVWGGENKEETSVIMETEEEEGDEDHKEEEAEVAEGEGIVGGGERETTTLEGQEKEEEEQVKEKTGENVGKGKGKGSAEIGNAEQRTKQDDPTHSNDTVLTPAEQEVQEAQEAKDQAQADKEAVEEQERVEAGKIEAERAKFASRMLGTKSSSSSMFAGLSQGGEGAEGGEGAPSMQIKVVLRCRPLFQHEKLEGSLDVVRCTMNDVTVLPVPSEGSHSGGNSKKSKKHRERFSFERVYGRDASQQEVFEESCRPSIMNAIEGYNVTIFAYGQTGTGKTYTMEGLMNDTERAGIIPRSVYSVFDVLESTCVPGDYEVTVSHLEIYQEELNDLLSPLNDAESLTARLSKRRFTTSLALATALKKRGIQITYDPKQNHSLAVDALRNGRVFGPLGDVLRSRIMQARLDEVEKNRTTQLDIAHDEDRGVVVRNLTERKVTTPEEIFDVLEHSTAKRVTAETMCNGQSSRSHSIFTLNVHVKERDGNNRLTGSTRIGRLNLVDLSGSENRKRAGGPGVGVRASESKAINQGLLSLGRVIKARTENGEHVPFRDSKLTRILEESLGGNCITTLILTVSPNHKEVGETLSTLNYAHKAKVIENRPTKFIREDPKSDEEGEEGDSEDGSGSEGEDDGNRKKKRKGKRYHDTDQNEVMQLRKRMIMPWSGRVPMRASQPRVARVAQTEEPRMLHAPSVEWVQTNLLSRHTDHPFKLDVHQTQRLNNENEAKQFGFTSSRTTQAMHQKSTTLSIQAQRALREVFHRFDREQLKTLQQYLNSPTGEVLSRAVQSFGRSHPQSRRSNSSSSSNGNSNNTKRTNKSSRSSVRSTTSNNNMLPPHKFGLIDEGIFLRVFAAAGTLDPIRAAYVVAKLGYRPNFSIETPGSKMNQKASGSRTSRGPSRGTSRGGAKGVKKIAKRPASASGTRRRRPASAASGVRGGKSGKNKSGKRPSTAGARRAESGMQNSHSSFLKGSITPRHRKGPMDFYWRFLGEELRYSTGTR